MYIYFDTNGTIKEIVNDKSIRNGSNEANKIYCYLEGEPEIDDIWYLQKLPSGELSNEVSFKNSTITKAIPYDAKRDMKYFKDFEQYKFYVFTLNTFLTSQKGLNIATIRVSVDNTMWALGELTFNVQENVINVDNGITQSQYDYLLLAYASRTLNEQVGRNLNDLIDDKIEAKLGDLASGSPKVFDTEYNIEHMQDDEGIAVATDTGDIWVWNDTQEEYVNTNYKYIADVSLFYTKTESNNTFAPKTTAVKFYGNQLMGYDNHNIYPVSVCQETYDNLKTMKTNGTLASGVYYRIVDYVTKTNGVCNGNADDLRSAEHPFDIIVQAISNTEFSEEAFATRQDGAGNYFANSDLSAWRIWYCFENDVDRFEWADTVNGKGVIYRMIDEFGNDLPYDFKNIQFKRYKITGTSDQRQSNAIGKYLGFYGNYSCVSDKTDYEWYFTFTKRSDKSDLSLTSIEESTIANSYYVKQVKIGEYLTDVPNYRGKQALNNIVIESSNIIVNIEMGKGSHHNTWIGNQDITYSYFKEMCRNNILYGEVMHTRADECFEQNMMGDFTNLGTYTSCWNKFSHHFNSNTSISMQSNDFEAQCGSCKFPNSFSRNHVAGMWGSVNAGTHNTFNRCEFGYMANVTLSGTGTWDGVENVMCYYVTIKITNLFGSKLGRMEYVSISEGTNNYNILNLTVGAIYGASNKVLTIALADLNSYELQTSSEKKIDFALDIVNNVKALTYVSRTITSKNIEDGYYLKGTISTVDGTVSWAELTSLSNKFAEVKTYTDNAIQNSINILRWELGSHTLDVESDTDTKYLKNVLSGAIGCQINKVGGMSYKCLNLANASLFEIGAINLSTGGDDPRTNRMRSNYIEVKPNTQYTLKWDGDDVNYVLYGENKEKIYNAIGGTLITTTTTKYIRFYAGLITPSTQIMLNEGSTALPYEPYFSGIRDSAVTDFNSYKTNLYQPTAVSTTSNGITYTISSDGTITMNGTSTATVMIITSADLPAGTYTWYLFNKTTCYNSSLSSLDDNLRMDLRASGAPIVSSLVYFDSTNKTKSFTISSSADSIYIRIGSGVTINSLVFKPLLTNGSSGIKDTLAIPSAIQNLTGYGWGVNSICYNYIDYENKKFVQKVGRVDLGTLTWSYDSGNTRFATTISNAKVNGTTRLTEFLCDKYTCLYNGETFNPNWNMVAYVGASNEFYFHNLSFTSATAFKTAMNGIYLYYELATPVEIDISAYLTTDTIDVEPLGTLEFTNTYSQDVPSDIDYLIEEVKA